MPKMIKLMLCCGVMLCLFGCDPARHFDETAGDFTFKSALIATSRFSHKIYTKLNTHSTSNSKRLHVYIDGDGSPWEQEQWLADDPTARDPLILRLMAEDPAPSILLGRPCYYGLSRDSHCHYKYWTSHRYAEEVVDSMAAALQQFLATQTATEIILIGFSGGGSLAMLMAPRLKQVRGVITLAANLDTAAWSRLHAYPPLKDSLNPADLPELDSRITQVHFAAEQDHNVPPDLIQAVASKQKAHFQILQDLTHNGCWECRWSRLLAQLLSN